jgi:tellurite resistance protein
MMMSEPLAETLRQLHPLRTQRYMFSDANPLLWPVQYAAPWVKQYRRKAASDNPFLLWEKSISSFIKSSLDGFRNYRDQYQENVFKLVYDNPWMKTLYPDIFTESKNSSAVPVHSEQAEIEKKLWQKVMVKGGFVAAIIRIILIASMADRSVDIRQFIKAQQVVRSHDQLKRFLPDDIKRHVKEQAAIVTYDYEAAIATLPKLLKSKKERVEAYEIATQIASADLCRSEDEKAILLQLKKTLGV